MRIARSETVKLRSVRADLIRAAVPVVVASAVAVTDLVTKAWAKQHLSNRLPAAGGIVRLVLARNRGVSFGLGTGHPAVIFAGVLISISAMTWWLTYARGHVERSAVAIALGGAVGNVIDRVAHGAVTDWLYVAPYPAAFNVADLAVRGGIAAAALCRLVQSLTATSAALIGRGWKAGRVPPGFRCSGIRGHYATSRDTKEDVMSSAASTQPARPARTATRATTSSGLGHAVAVGAGGGLVASLVMAGYAMIASISYQHRGFFTPLYHIASLFIAPKTMMTSMMHAMGGSSFYFSAGPAITGAVIHMMTGLLYGAVFAAVVWAARLRGAAVVAAGAVWGVLVFAASTWLALPVAAKIFSSGDQITHMAKMVGYPTFLLEHVLFGLALGLLAAAGLRRRS